MVLYIKTKFRTCLKFTGALNISEDFKIDPNYSWVVCLALWGSS